MLKIMGRRTLLMMTNKPFSFVLFISTLQTVFVRVEGANCDPVYYDPVSNCTNHALRIGYYSSPNCGSLNQLTDSDSKPNAYYARLNHPATYISNGQTKYYEYSAGSHLSIKLTRHALIHGIALQGSPNGLRYYLSSFQLSSKTTVHSLDVTQSPTINSDFYRESGEIKEFTGDMRNTRKFTIPQPFYANEIIVYPLLFHGDRVFRMELYGCFLGRISVPAIIGVGHSATFSFVQGQTSNASSYQYYLHVKEPNGTLDLLPLSPSANYSFLSRGKSTLTLGVKLGAGWVDADQTIVTVQGPIIGLQMKISYSTASIYKAKENEYLQFRLEESEQPYQIKIVSFAFGDGTNCLHNYCMKRFLRGVYAANGTASNDFYQATKHATVVSCPNSPVGVTYPSEISVSGNAIRYNGPSSPHNFTITFYALWMTTFEVRLNGSLTQTETFSGVGWTSKIINLPNGLRPPVLYNLNFNYTDYCRETTSTAIVLVDEEIDGLSVRLNQTFKEELIQAVPYYFKDKPVHIYLDVAKGTSLSCSITIFDVTSTTHAMAPVVKDRIFLTTSAFASPGNTFPNVSATCQNRNNFRVATLSAQTFDFRQIPEPVTNLSVSLSSNVISTFESLTVNFVLGSGNQMNCTVNLTTAGMVATYTANELYEIHEALAGSSKQYSFSYSNLQYGPSHLVRVMCRNILAEESKETLLEVQIPVSGVGIIAPKVGCFGTTITVNSTVTAGKPVTKELLIDSVKKIERPSSVIKDSAFFINSTHYGPAGLKQIYINVWNTVTPSKLGAGKVIRITRTITNLDLGIQFTISSSQGLSDRPYLHVPINEVVTFSAQVTPADNGYIYDWSIDGATTASNSTASSNYQFTFSSTGLWKLRLVVRGCADVSLERNLTAVGPISDFTLATVPTPETVVNKTTKINAEHPVNAHCLELDFGDSSDAMKNCINNTGPHPLNCFTSGSTCSVDHVYDRGGVFTVNLTASNGLFKLAKEVEITAKTCYNPILTVEGDGISLDDPGSSSAIANSKTLRSDALKYNISSVIMDCKFTSTYSITWKVFSGRDGSSYADVNRTDSSLLLSDSIFTFLRSNHELAIPCCTLPYGILSVSVEVQVTGNDLTNSFKAKKILNTFIGHTAPIAVLQSNKFRAYGYNTMVTINASSSNDPDKFAQDLSITWYCRDTNLEPRDLSIIPSFPLLNHTNIGLSQPVTGCFGSAVGRIDTGEFSKILQFNSMLLQTNHTIEITAVVSNTTSVGNRKSNVSRSFLVLTKETPYLEISCIHNCGERVDPMSRLTLDAKCYGDACAQNPVYKWSLFRDNSTHNTTVTLDSILHSFDDEKNLRIKPNVLEQGMRYTLVLRGTGIGGAYYEVAYSFETNKGPTNGTCSVNPLSGVAVFEMLRTDCYGWIDGDLPLSYEVVILGDISPINLCALSSSISCAVYLPDGYKDNSTINIRIRIYDSLNMFSEVTKEVKVYSSSCDSVIYNSPADCGANPLRIGYYSSCREFHSLSDSSNGLNAHFARLNHPAYSNSKFYEYEAGQYLEIKLARVASIHAIAIQGSPDALRYYLKSFTVWYQISKNRVADGSPADPFNTFYTESIDAKMFTSNMNITTKFTFNNPFYAEVLRVHPLSFYGKKVFRVELYGCYLGKLNVPKPVKVSTPTTIGFTKLKVPSGSIFYLKITEPNKHSTMLDIQNTTQYTFNSSGRARVELGLKYDDGWVTIDYKEVDVLGPISGLSLFSDGYSLSPYKCTTYKQVHFSINGISDPLQITSINFNFGDSTNCTHNNCIKTLSHGLYRVSCTISNDFFHQNLKTDIISCPLVTLNANYTPPVYKGGIGVSFQGLNANHVLSIMFFALWKTKYNAYFNGQEIVNETIAEAEGWITQVVQLPNSLLAPSSNALFFNYTDVCGYSTASETVFIDEKIRSLSLEVVQAFKLQLIEAVPHLFKNHPVNFNFKIENGTSVVCNVTIDEIPVNSTTSTVPQRLVSATINVSNKKFTITHNFTSSEDSNINVTCTCWNRLFYPAVQLPDTSLNVRRIPERIENFSLNVSKRALNNSETFQLFIFLEKGEDMTCNVTLNSTKIPQSYNYDRLLQTQAAASNSRKSYTIDVIAHSVTPNLLVAVACRNVFNVVQGNVTVTVVEVAVEGLTIDVDEFLCHGSPMLIKRNVTRGSPINDIVYINGVNASNTMTFDENTILSLDHSLYGIAGVKEVSVESSNSVNSLLSSKKQVKVAMTITNVDVLMNFTFSSPQGLPQRPALVLPVADRINFTAIVTPQANGYIYNWSINGAIGESNNTFWSYSFPTVGSYLFHLSVTGCREFIFQRNIAVLSPIDTFEVKTDPSPECVVNKNTLITITHAKHSECLELDFGDGSPNISQCQSHATLPSFNCFTNGSLCTTTHVYRASGSYTVKVVASNRLFARTVTVNVAARVCVNPAFTVEGNGTKVVSLTESYFPLQHLRSQPVLFTIPAVTVNCYFSPNYSIHWQVFSLKVNSTVNKATLLTHGQEYQVSNSTILFDNNYHSIRIPCCYVHYGELIVSVDLKMKGHYLIGGFKSSKIFATQIGDTKLVAELVEKSHKSYAYNSTITLNASLSHDPDQYSNLTYTWYCRDISEEPRDIFSITDLPLISRTFFMAIQESRLNYTNHSSTVQLNSSFSVTPTPVGRERSLGSRTSASGTSAPSDKEAAGCFGVSAGILDVPNTWTEVSFNSMSLTTNRTIEFTVLVEAMNPLRRRKSSANHSLTVLLPLTPIFQLKCTDNCKSRLDPTHKFTLITICQSGTCATNATFVWTMEEYNHTSRRKIDLKDILYPSDEVRNFYMRPNVLTPGSNYSLVVRATAPDESYFEQRYIISVNIQPLNGTCVADPENGEAIYTTFNINCSRWIDTERPLTYEVAHFNDVLTTVVCRQHSETCRTLLPMASTSSNLLYIRIRIIDNMGMFSELYLNITMRSPELQASQLNDFLSSLNNITNNMDAARYIGAVTSVLNANVDNRTTEEANLKIEFRDKATQALMKMVGDASDDVIAPLISLLAEVPNEYSFASGSASTDGLKQMTNALVSDEQNIIFRDIVSRSKSLLAAMGMVMKSTSVNLNPNLKVKNESNFTENPLKWTTPQGREIVLSNTMHTQSLVNTMLQRMSPAEVPVAIVTSNLGINIERNYGSKMNQTTNILLMDGRITLPSLEDMNLNKDLTISSVTKFTTFNSFFWQETSKLINSSLIDFELKSFSSILGVSNTKQAILLSIPRKLERPIPFQHWTFHEAIGKEKLNFHTMKIENGNSLHTEFKPMNYCIDYEIFIKFGSRPSRDNYFKNWTVPDLSTCGDVGMQQLIRANICSAYQNIVSKLNQTRIVESESSINCTLMEQLELEVNNIVKSCRLYPYRVFILDTETSDGTYFFSIYEKNGTLSNITTSAEMLNATTSCQLIDHVNQSSYFLRSFTSKCRFWNTISEKWEAFGCQVGDESDIARIQCKCNHLTSFASDFFVAPNPIDIDKVLEGFKNINDNVSVVVLLSLLFGLFLLLAVRLRRRDKEDASKVGVVSVQHNPTDSYQYLIITITGARVNAGTTANVYCTLNNSEMKGKPRLLIDLENPAFQRDQINAFIISYEEPIENITDMRIWHDNKGDSPSWYLSRVYIEDLTTNKTYSFICEQWLAVEFEDGLIDRSLGVASEDDNKIFTHIFTTKTAKDFSDEHLWLSLFLKRPHDSFTRVQRVACCMALLCLTMLASAMFFQLGNDSKYLWKIGSLVIDFKGIIIGIQSGLVVIPVSAIILAIFRNTESFEQYKKRRKARNHDGTTAKRGKLLPCGFLVVGWFLAMVAVLGSSVVVLFYSMQWGNEKSQQFVISIFTSFIESAFIIQPVKLVVFAMLLAAIFKRSQEETNVLEMYKFSANVQTLDLKESGINVSNKEPKPLTEEQQESARNRRFMEIRLRLFLQELVSYIIFLMFLALVVRGYRDTDEYYFSKALRDDIVHEHFDKVRDIPAIWTWAQNHFIPAIYSQEWYNGDNYSNFKMTRNQEAYRLGLARIRQVRVRPNTCSVVDDAKGIVNRCNAGYSFENDDEGDYDIGWKNLTNSNRKRRQVEEATANGRQAIRQRYMLKHSEMKRREDISTSVHGAWRLNHDLGWAAKDLQEKFRKKIEGKSHYESGNMDEIDDIFRTDINFQHQNADSDPPNKYNRESDRFLETQTLATQSKAMKPNTDYNMEEETILRRSRRALKLKIKRTTGTSFSNTEHPEIISIDEQYLLPSGKIKPNKQHWLYNDMSSLRGFPYYGHFATYSGGGYVASLSTDIDFARATAMALEQDSWVDMRTRALFFEFSVYNGNMNFFATGFVIIEILPTGSVVPNANIRVFKLYRYVGTFGRLVMASEIILLLCLLFFIYKECRHMYRLGWGYFKLFWSWIEITIAVALFTALILRAFSWYEGDKNLIALRENMEQFINFHYTVVADDALLTAVMIISFFSTLKVIKIIEVFPTIVFLKGTLRRCLKPLMNYAFPFVVAFCAFAMLFHLTFHETELFMSYLDTAETQLLMLIGGSVFSTLQEAHSFLGPVFFFLFAILETVVFMNVFLAIINDGISESAHWSDGVKADEFFEFMEERVQLMLQVFSDSIQKTISKVPLGFQKFEGTSSVSEGDSANSDFIANSKKKKGGDSIETAGIVIKRLEDKLSQSFQTDRHDMKNFLILLVRLGKMKANAKKNAE